MACRLCIILLVLTFVGVSVECEGRFGRREPDDELVRGARLGLRDSGVRKQIDHVLPRIGRFGISETAPGLIESSASMRTIIA